MPQQFLHCPDIVAGFQKMRRKRVAERVRGGRPGNPGGTRGILDRPLQDGFVQVMTPPFPVS